MTVWSITFWLIVSLILLYPLNRWISSHVQGVAFLLTGSQTVAVWVFWVLFLPGTLLHELSHWLTAVLLLVKTRSFSLWPKRKAGGQLQMGAVQIDVADPFRHSLIGLAPLLFGSIAVLIISYGWLGLDRLGQALVSGNLEQLLYALNTTLSVPDIWLWLYLIFAISNAMLPSASDREAWRTVIIYLLLALVLAIGLGVNPTFSSEIQELVLQVLSYLLFAFALTIVLNLGVIALIILLEHLLALLLGRRVQYNQRR